jgi:hypothetical protein
MLIAINYENIKKNIVCYYSDYQYIPIIFPEHDLLDNNWKGLFIKLVE